MNSYENKNEYEILESSSNNTNMPNRYPFANDPNIFPIILDDCQGKPWQNTWKSVSSILSAGFTLLRFLQAPSPVLGATALLGLINLLIPSSGPSVASLSICDLLSIIRKEVDQSVLDDGVADFNGKLTNYREYYLSSLQEWLTAGKPNDRRLIDVVDYFKKSEEGFNEILAGSLSRQNAQILLLPTYTQAANVQLLLLRDAVQYKKEWGALLSAEKVGSELISPTIDYGQRLKDKIAQYTKYCLSWYQEGLNQIKEGGASAETWLKFNKFRREMTLAVLDIIALFPTYDFAKYPLGTSVELTREIYTDPVGYSGGVYEDWKRGFSFNLLEANGTRGPGLVTWLQAIDIYSHTVANYLTGWGGTRHYEDYTKGNGAFQRMSGTTSNDPHPISFGTTDIFKIRSLARYILQQLVGYSLSRHRVSRAEFFLTTPYTLLYERNSSGNSQTIESVLPGSDKDLPPSRTNYSHRLSNAACVQQETSVVTVFGWTHTSMTRNNPIYPDKITQIPAVKAFALENDAYVSAGPGDTGGDVVTLRRLGRLKIRLNPASTSKNYRVRIRYSSWASGAVLVERWSPSGVVNNVFPVPYTPGSTYGYVNTLVTTFNQSGVEIIIENRHNSDIIIDKIEFLPDDLTTLASEGERNLEKTKNAVNDLFIN
ncbi:insecticidal delta-endotoxin Cry8Ea1 family protein [Bacillus thuringiensis]|uniref:insecticidal delta-endotoxin Cry8Ea1 family protein n=1 Tax=Bacillus thuringiensis TaxID=1428 RepID=UPI002AC9E54A|nr:insecticidal delta-endotoxin Cry8Ea1 family protein [Bacillus thuringiensis]